MCWWLNLFSHLGALALPATPAAWQPSGVAVSVRFRLRATGTSTGQERVSLPAAAVTGALGWSPAGNATLADPCPLDATATRLVCDLSPRVTFFRNTDADVWLFFTPAVQTVGQWTAAVRFEAENFQPSGPGQSVCCKRQSPLPMPVSNCRQTAVKLSFDPFGE